MIENTSDGKIYVKEKLRKNSLFPKGGRKKKNGLFILTDTHIHKYTNTYTMTTEPTTTEPTTMNPTTMSPIPVSHFPLVDPSSPIWYCYKSNDLYLLIM